VEDALGRRIVTIPLGEKISDFEFRIADLKIRWWDEVERCMKDGAGCMERFVLPLSWRYHSRGRPPCLP